MIKVEHGSVSISGIGSEILAEATIMLEAVYDTFEKQGGETFAMACIASVLENYRGIMERRWGDEDDDEEVESNFEDIDPLWWD